MVAPAHTPVILTLGNVEGEEFYAKRTGTSPVASSAEHAQPVTPSACNCHSDGPLTLKACGFAYLPGGRSILREAHRRHLPRVVRHICNYPITNASSAASHTITRSALAPAYTFNSNGAAGIATIAPVSHPSIKGTSLHVRHYRCA
jgi:hypothetical protein